MLLRRGSQVHQRQVAGTPGQICGGGWLELQCSLATKKTLRFARNKIYLMLMYTRSSS